MHNLLLSLVYFFILCFWFGGGFLVSFLSWPFLSLPSLSLCICNSNPITETHTSAFSFFPSIPHLNQTNQINDSAPPLGASTTHADIDTPSRKRNRRANLVLRYAALFPSPFGVDSAIVSKNVSSYLLVPSHLGSLADWRLSFPFLLPRHPPCTHLDPKYYAMSCASGHTTPSRASYPSPSRHVNNVSWTTTIMPATSWNNN